MIGVCFHREQAWEQDQWSFVFSNFGVTDIWERGFDGNNDLKIYQPTIKVEKSSELPDKPLVLLAHPEGRYFQGNQSLVDFAHPEDAIYYFGGSQLNVGDDMDRKPDYSVYIPTQQHEMYSHAAAYITLYDRLVKNG